MRAWIWASRRSSGTPARVSITPPSSAARRPPWAITTPYPVFAVPGSMPRTITDGRDSASGGGRLPLSARAAPGEESEQALDRQADVQGQPRELREKLRVQRHVDVRSEERRVGKECRSR